MTTAVSPPSTSGTRLGERAGDAVADQARGGAGTVDVGMRERLVDLRAELLVDVAARPDQLEAVDRLGGELRRAAPEPPADRCPGSGRPARVETVDPVVAFGAGCSTSAARRRRRVVASVGASASAAGGVDALPESTCDRSSLGLVAVAHRGEAGGDVDRRRSASSARRATTARSTWIMSSASSDLARREQRLGRAEVDRGGIRRRRRQRIAGRRSPARRRGPNGGHRTDGAGTGVTSMSLMRCAGQPADALLGHQLGRDQHGVAIDRRHPLEQPAEVLGVADAQRAVLELGGVEGAGVDQARHRATDRTNARRDRSGRGRRRRGSRAWCRTRPHR